MSRPAPRALLAAAAWCLLTIPAMAAAQDPFTGTWRLNLAKSNLPPPVPMSIVSHIRCDATSLTVTEEIVGADGKRLTASATAKFDGKDYPVVGAPLIDAVSYERVDARTIRSTSKKGGKVLARETVVVSPDGRTFTATYKGLDAQGQEVVGTAFFEKQ